MLVELTQSTGVDAAAARAQLEKPGRRHAVGILVGSRPADINGVLISSSTVEYETVVGERAMHTIVGRLRSPDGRLIGWTEQLVAVYG